MILTKKNNNLKYVFVQYIVRVHFQVDFSCSGAHTALPVCYFVLWDWGLNFTLDLGELSVTV